jgi:hypothetical protein
MYSDETDFYVDILAKQKELELLHKQLSIVDKGGIEFYKPHPKQDLFHRAGHYKYRYMRTGNRFGKSDMGAAEDVAWCVGERLWLSENDPDRFKGIPQHAVKGLLVVINWDKAEEIFTSLAEGERRGKLFKMIPADALVDFHRNQQGKINRIEIKSRWGGSSQLYLTTVKTFKNDALSSESSDWDFIHVDEPLPQAMWEGISRGLMDRNGHAWFCCTPLDQPWINDFFVPNKRSTTAQLLQQGTKWMMTGSSRDNPYNSKEGMDGYFAGLDERTRRCREDGEPLGSSGVVYSEFDRSVHVYNFVPHGWKKANQPPKSYTIRIAIDPHPSTPHAVLFAATAPTGEVFFYAEYFEPVDLEELTKSIKETLNGHEPEIILLDPLAFINNPVDNTTMAQKIEEGGLVVVKAPKDLTRGILEVKRALKERIHTQRGAHPRLLFSEDLLETLWEFERYMWDPKHANKPIDKDDHMMENLYRLVINGLEYVHLSDAEISFRDGAVYNDCVENDAAKLVYG